MNWRNIALYLWDQIWQFHWLTNECKVLYGVCSNSLHCIYPHMLILGLFVQARLCQQLLHSAVERITRKSRLFWFRVRSSWQLFTGHEVLLIYHIYDFVNHKRNFFSLKSDMMENVFLNIRLCHVQTSGNDNYTTAVQYSLFNILPVFWVNTEQRFHWNWIMILFWWPVC